MSAFDFDEWLNTPGLFRTILVEINYTLLGVPKTLHVSNAAYLSHGTDTPTYQPYDAFITSDINFKRQLSEIFTGKSRYELTKIDLLNQENVSDLLIAATANHQIKILIGDNAQPLANFQVIVDALIEDVLPGKDRVIVKIKDKAKSLATPYLTDVFSSGIGEGKVIPKCLGRCFNISPVLIDDTLHVYQFNIDESQALTAARFNGALVSTSDYTVDLVNSKITFTTQPQGTVTLDVDGSKSGGTWLQTATEMIEHLVPGATITGLPDYLLGLYITGNRTTANIIDEICASVGGYWFYDRVGTYICEHFNGTSGVYDHELTDEQNIESTRLPQRKIAPVHQRNFTVMSNVAEVVFDSDLALAEQLQTTGNITQRSDVSTLANYPESLIISDVPTLIVNLIDVNTESDRRLALRNMPHFVYQTQQLAGALTFKLGDELLLETNGLNGHNAVITKLDENISTGKTIVSFWQ